MYCLLLSYLNKNHEVLPNFSTSAKHELTQKPAHKSRSPMRTSGQTDRQTDSIPEKTQRNKQDNTKSLVTLRKRGTNELGDQTG
jgi:hypothetical protein